MHFSRSYDRTRCFFITPFRNYGDLCGCALEFAACAVPEVHRPVSAREEEDEFRRTRTAHPNSDHRDVMSLHTFVTCLDAYSRPSRLARLAPWLIVGSRRTTVYTRRPVSRPQLHDRGARAVTVLFSFKMSTHGRKLLRWTDRVSPASKSPHVDLERGHRKEISVVRLEKLFEDVA